MTVTFAVISRKLGKDYQWKVRGLPKLNLLNSQVQLVVWGAVRQQALSRYQCSKHKDAPSWQCYTCLEWLLSYFIISFQLFFHTSWSLFSSLCPIKQLTILTCLYWSHPPLAYWMFLSDQQRAMFFLCPLSILTSLFSLLSVFSICYLTKRKHQGLWSGNDAAGSRVQRAACEAKTGSTNCTCQPVINVATKRGRITMQSHRS